MSLRFIKLSADLEPYVSLAVVVHTIIFACL